MAHLTQELPQADRPAEAFQIGALPRETIRTRIETIKENASLQLDLAQLNAEHMQSEVARVRVLGAQEFIETLRPKLLDADLDTQ